MNEAKSSASNSDTNTKAMRARGCRAGQGRKDQMATNCGRKSANLLGRLQSAALSYSCSEAAMQHEGAEGEKAARPLE